MFSTSVVGKKPRSGKPKEAFGSDCRLNTGVWFRAFYGVEVPVGFLVVVCPVSNSMAKP